MNTESTLSLLRSLFAIFVGYAVGHGWLTPADAGALTTFATTAGPILIPAAMSLYAHWDMKKVPQEAIAVTDAHITATAGGGAVAVTGKIVPCLLALVVMLSLLQLAQAGDIKVPANARAAVFPPPADPCTVTQCSGLYVGVDLTGINSNLDILGSGIAGSFGAGGQMLGIHGGYQLWNGTWFAAAEVGCAYNLTQNFNALGTDPSNKFLCTELIKGGFALSGLFGIGSGAAATPSQGPVPINIPAALLNSLTSPYFIVGAAQRFSKNGFVSGAGAEFVLAQGINVGAEYLHINYNAQVNPVLTLDTENLFRIYLNRKF